MHRPLLTFAKKGRIILLMQKKNKALGYYVYICVDPRNGKPFYVGKGKNTRVLAHFADEKHDRLKGKKTLLREVKDGKKRKTINAIYNAGKIPQIVFLRHGLAQENLAFLVEAAAIDLLKHFGVGDLTNIVSGKTGKDIGYGLAKTPRALREMLAELNPERVKVEHESVLFNLNRDYTHGMSEKEIRAVTHCCWRIDRQRASKAKYAMAVHEGVVREVYRIKDNSWYASTNYPGRSGFCGEVAENSIREKYVGKFVGKGKKGAQTPFRYAGF